MWAGALQLSFLRQPTLPKVPWPTDRAVAGATRRAPAALFVLSVDLHRPGRAACSSPWPPEGGLRVIALLCRGQSAKALPRSPVAGGSARLAGSLTHLDPGHALSSPRPFPGQRRGLV